MEYSKKELSEKVAKTGWLLLIIGVLIIALSFTVNKERAMFNYLWMYMFLVSIGIGSLALVSLEYLVGATWSTPFRRVSEFLAAVTPALVILVIPLLYGMHDLYHWTHSEAVKGDELLQSKAPYLNLQFFIIRVGICLLIWLLFYLFFIRNSEKQDQTKDPKLTTKNIRLSVVFTPLFIITITVAAVDWMMSLEPHWYSTIFGVYYFAGTVVASLAAVTLISVLLKEGGYLHPRITNQNFYSLGTMLFGFNVFWTYIAFSQYLLIWYADLPEETFWLMHRWEGSWKYVSIALLFVHFIIPFLVLISRNAKTNLKTLKIMSVWMLFAHMLDLYWLIMPTYSK
ncbi:MAG: quinol:cytochrome C oxidoreductase, partial [Ignavibacteria bacterium]